MAQLSYTDDPPIAYHGMKADSARNDDTISMVCEEAGTDGIPMGSFVCRGTGDNQCELPDAAGDVAAGALLGVALFQSMKTSGAYALYEAVPVYRAGRVRLRCEDAFTAGDQVFVRHTATGAEVLGAVRTDDDTLDAVAINGRFLDSGSAGDLALVEFDLQGS